jgi:hypothetical protein
MYIPTIELLESDGHVSHPIIDKRIVVELIARCLPTRHTQIPLELIYPYHLIILPLRPVSDRSLHSINYTTEEVLS